jgi:predicted phosphodiesterase
MAIVIGDIHGDIEKATAFLEHEPEKEHVALGDYLDSYTVGAEQQLECLKLLMASNAVLLLGNHECHYLKNPLFRFAGYNFNHARMFQEILEVNIQRFKVAYAVDGWLCTHAGVNSQYTEQESNVAVLAEIFNNSWELYLKHRLADHHASYLYQSIFRFNFRIFVEGNLLPTNIKQIFGHVENNNPIVEQEYIALDTTNNSNRFWIYDTEKNSLLDIGGRT